MRRALAGVVLGVGTAALLAAPTAPATAATCTAKPWRLVGTDTFSIPDVLTRSQGVTSTGTGWLFSWQGGLQRTDDAYAVQAVTTIPPTLLVNQTSIDPTTGTNHVGDIHIGDVDVHGGVLYAPVEDGGESAGPLAVNDPEYQHPFIAEFDATTLAFLRSTELPLDQQAAGVPWVAVDPSGQEIYTDEWEMPHDRLNVYDPQLHFQRHIDLHYPASLGPKFHLSRIQGAKVLGHTMYGTRDDDAKSVFTIDLRTGDVSKLFSLDPTGSSNELEGLAVRPTADSALLHVLLVQDGDIGPSGEFVNAKGRFEHWAPPVECPAAAGTARPTVVTRSTGVSRPDPTIRVATGSLAVTGASPWLFGLGLLVLAGAALVRGPHSSKGAHR